MLKTIIIASLLFTGCKKSSSQCEDVYDHTMSLVPDELKDKMSGSKDDAIAKCEKMSPEARQCALDAKEMGDLMKCPRK
jgi:hypothetical protein